LFRSLRISGQLPAAVVNGGGDSFCKWKNFQILRARGLDLHLGSGYTAYVVHHSSTSTYIPNFIEIEKKLLCTNGRTIETSFIRSTLKSRPNSIKGRRLKTIQLAR